MKGNVTEHREGGRGDELRTDSKSRTMLASTRPRPGARPPFAGAGPGRTRGTTSPRRPAPPPLQQVAAQHLDDQGRTGPPTTAPVSTHRLSRALLGTTRSYTDIVEGITAANTLVSTMVPAAPSHKSIYWPPGCPKTSGAGGAGGKAGCGCRRTPSAARTRPPRCSPLPPARRSSSRCRRCRAARTRNRRPSRRSSTSGSPPASNTSAGSGLP